MRPRFAIPLLLVAAASGALSGQTRPATRPAPLTPAPRPSARAFTERYGVLIDDNIFLRERGRAAPPSWRGPMTRPSTQPRSEEQSFALLGVVFEGDDFRAYFESLRDASIVRVEPGDAVARGRVVEMQADAVAYEAEGRVVWIEVGQDLTGSASRSASSATQPSDSTTQPAATPGDPALQSIEERMRQRRRQMMNGQ